MRNPRLLYTRAAQTRLQRLPLELRLHVETHLENLALLAEATLPERLSEVLTRTEDGFVSEVRGVRVYFVMNAVARTLLVYRLLLEPSHAWEASRSAVGHE